MVMNVANALAAYTKNSGGASSLIGGGSDGAATSGTGSFSDMMKSYAGDAVNTLKQGELAANAGATGKADLAGVVTAINSAELMLQTVVTIRDKVIAAYQDITKTAI